MFDFVQFADETAWQKLFSVALFGGFSFLVWAIFDMCRGWRRKLEEFIVVAKRSYNEEMLKQIKLSEDRKMKK